MLASFMTLFAASMVPQNLASFTGRGPRPFVEKSLCRRRKGRLTPTLVLSGRLVLQLVGEYGVRAAPETARGNRRGGSPLLRNPVPGAEQEMEARASTAFVS